MIPEMADEAIYQSSTTVKTILVNFARANVPMIVGGVEVVSANPMAIAITSDIPDAVQGDTLKIDDTTYNIMKVEAQGDNTTILDLTLD